MQHVTQDNVPAVTPNNWWAPSCRSIPDYSWYFFLLIDIDLVVNCNWVATQWQ